MSGIWVVEDDENIRELVLYALDSSGFKAVGYESGNDLWETIRKDELPDLIMLDVMLPGDNGLNILRRLRGNETTKGIPIIMVTAKGAECDRVKGLDMGADDYITKPFSVLELISRVRAVLRRSSKEVGEKLNQNGIVMDLDRRSVTVDGKNITLTYKEFELLNYLMSNPGVVLSRDRIMSYVWGVDFECETRTVDMHVKTLRQKLGTGGNHIKTVRGIGYKIGD